MKKLLYVVVGIAWTVLVFLKPLFRKDKKEVNFIHTAFVNLILWPVCMIVFAYNSIMGKERLFEGKKEDEKPAS